MNSLGIIQRLHQHRRWVNANLLQTAAECSVEQLQTPLSIGQGSIWKSLLHMHAAEYVWLGALEGLENPLLPGDLPGRLPGNQLGSEAIAHLEELKQKWSALEERWGGYLSTLIPESLDDVVYKTSTSSGAGQRFGTRRADILLHVCPHAHYTAAQVVNMFRHVGVKKLPDTMLISLARFETA